MSLTKNNIIKNDLTNGDSNKNGSSSYDSKLPANYCFYCGEECNPLSQAHSCCMKKIIPVHPTSRSAHISTSRSHSNQPDPHLVQRQSTILALLTNLNEKSMGKSKANDKR